MAWHNRSARAASLGAVGLLVLLRELQLGFVGARQRAPAIGLRPRAALPRYVPTERVEELSETEALEAIEKLTTVPLELPANIASGPVDVTYLSTSVEPQTTTPPLLLVHGFDISCLEFRRLMPLLEKSGVEAYALCVLGWGFTDTTNVNSVGIEAKRAQLVAFWETVLGGRPMILVGASLGANIAADFCAYKPEAVESMVMLAPGIFTEPPPAVPEFIARALIENVLGSPGVRASIAKQAYFAKEKQTEDAIRVGQLHVLRPEWAEDSTEWLQSGGYTDQGLVDRISAVRCLTLWGRNDEVIPAESALPKLIDAFPSVTFRWVEASGHTPHLEQPEVTAAAIVAFVKGNPVAGDPDVSDTIEAARRSPIERFFSGLR